MRHNNVISVYTQPNQLKLRLKLMEIWHTAEAAETKETEKKTIAAKSIIEHHRPVFPLVLTRGHPNAEYMLCGNIEHDLEVEARREKMRMLHAGILALIIFITVNGC